ncbi:MAG: glutamate-5-semialdehyde dehydrogenase [Candidatus Faecousia sp.]|nr:glutamate-5-semialdehyde dehydrogenase [Candidatus Faecousia sp.]
MLEEIGKKAKQAARALCLATTEQKNDALLAMAEALTARQDTILIANASDLQAGREAGLSQALLDRLLLTPQRIEAMADGLRQVAALPDPVGRILSDTARPNGLHLVKVAVPMGVIAVIYEARPNVTADSAALCLKSGNAIILRGGKEAIGSNMAVCQVMRKALAATAISPDAVQLVTDTTHESANALMHLNEYVDVLIPRGGRRLIRTVLETATVPVIETGAGVCHIYVDKAADISMAAQIVCNAKTSRPSVCNAAECMLIHRDIASRALPEIARPLLEKQVQIRGDDTVCRLVPEAVPATEDDWGREYGDYIIAAKVVDSMEQAMEHIYRYSTGHSECIVTQDAQAAEEFLNGVDAAAVYHNASTRFTDGGEFGLGAEIGISTQKLHARGPLGLNELTSMKYKIYGSGQIR